MYSMLMNGMHAQTDDGIAPPHLLRPLCRYTGFTVRLDNATGTGALKYGAGTTNLNVLAVHVDPTFGTEWWYALPLMTCTLLLFWVVDSWSTDSGVLSVW